MPSWNIHIAHVERLLREEDPARLGIHDVDAFLLGNVAPDIYVGYMVHDISHKIEYIDTHFANPGHVPEPRFWEFWQRYAIPYADAQGHVSDLTLGVWCHLMADHAYNHWANDFLAKHHIAPGEQTRINKQTDFALYGRTLSISSVPELSQTVLAQALGFSQYPIEASAVQATCKVMQQIIDDNQAQHVSGTPSYTLLTPEFFAHTADAADQLMLGCLTSYAEHGAATCKNPQLPFGASALTLQQKAAKR